MKRALCAILFAVLIPSSSQAGFVGQINLSSGSGSLGSLTTNGPDGVGSVGAGSYIVGTNLSAPSFTVAGGVSSLLVGGYLDFNTGVFTGSDASGSHYAAGGNFFVLENPVYGSQPVYARDFTTDAATVKSLGVIDPTDNQEEYELTMGFSSAIINPPISTAFGTPSVAAYTGTIDFIYVIDSGLAGNQLLSGSISFSIPEPSSLAMLSIGGVGLLGFRRRLLNRRAS